MAPQDDDGSVAADEKAQAVAAVASGAVVEHAPDKATPNLQARDGAKYGPSAVAHEAPLRRTDDDDRDEDDEDDEDEGDGEHNIDYHDRVRDLEAIAPVQSNRAPFTVFTLKQKRFIVFMTACAGFFSACSANIYFPALNSLSRDFHVSSTLINLTLTSYMIFQGLAPTIMGDLADMAGRRPVYTLCFIIYIGACIGIALCQNYASLFILRCLQSTGCAATIALGSGVVADIATSSERGQWMGWATAGPMVAPALGPVLGGILAQFLGWRAIFWFLVILASCFLIPFLILFPETGRNVVGNGSIPPQGWNMSLLNYLSARRAMKNELRGLARTTTSDSKRAERDRLAKSRRKRVPNPLNTLRLVFEKDTGLLLLYNSLVYTAFYDVTASIPYLFNRIYGYNDLQVGLCFIPFGTGCLLAPILGGRLLDWNFRRLANKCGMPIDRKKAQDLKDFPLEKARCQVTWPLALVGTACLLCYGWVLEVNAPLPAPLVLHFIMGFTLTGAFNCNSVMLVDLYPLSPSTATAANNLVRCFMGAGGTAIIVIMIDSMGRGWCFTFIAAVVLLCTPILFVLEKWGPGWREARRVRFEAQKEIQRKLDEEEDENAARIALEHVTAAPKTTPTTTKNHARHPTEEVEKS